MYNEPNPSIEVAKVLTVIALFFVLVVAVTQAMIPNCQTCKAKMNPVIRIIEPMEIPESPMGLNQYRCGNEPPPPIPYGIYDFGSLITHRHLIPSHTSDRKPNPVYQKYPRFSITMESWFCRDCGIETNTPAELTENAVYIYRGTDHYNSCNSPRQVTYVNVVN